MLLNICTKHGVSRLSVLPHNPSSHWLIFKMLRTFYWGYPLKNDFCICGLFSNGHYNLKMLCISGLACIVFWWKHACFCGILWWTIMLDGKRCAVTWLKIYPLMILNSVFQFSLILWAYVISILTVGAIYRLHFTAWCSILHLFFRFSNLFLLVGVNMAE